MIRGTKGEGILKLRSNLLRCGREKDLGSICLLRISRPRRSPKPRQYLPCSTHVLSSDVARSVHPQGRKDRGSENSRRDEQTRQMENCSAKSVTKIEVDAIDVVIDRGGQVDLVPMRWGLIPSWWTKTAKEVPATFNARAETLAVKPMFRDALMRGRP